MSTTRIPGQEPELSEPRRIPTLTVIAHPDRTRLGDCCYLADLKRGGAIELSRGAPDFAPPGKSIGRPLADGFLSRSPIRLQLTATGGIELDTGRCRAELRIAGHPFHGNRTFSRAELRRGLSLCLAGRVVLYLHLSRAAAPPSRLHDMVGFSDAMNQVRMEIEKVADLSTPILLRGPSGSGKELAARAIYQAGGAQGPFVAVNMGSLPKNLAASELFGAVKGAFTGADRHQLGFFRAASGGTLFLDEIGEASPEVQVLLLRTLETSEVTPVGAQQSVRVDVRFIAATDADLEAKMAGDSFKAPLFHRLAGYEIGLPPLHERLEDFGVLFRHFSERELARMHQPYPRGTEKTPWLPAALVEALVAYHWPGNVRQLANAVRQIIIGCRGEPSLRMVPKVAAMLTQQSEKTTNAGPLDIPGRKPSDITESELKAALTANDYSPKAAAKTLRISRNSLYQLIERTPGLQKASDLNQADVRNALAQAEGDDTAAAHALYVSRRALRRRMTELGIQSEG